MSTPLYPVFDGDGTHAPKRPVASTDLGGLYKSDVLGYEPDPESQVTAADVKQWMMCIEAMGRMIPLLRVTCHVETGMGTAVPLFASCVNSTVTTAEISITEVSPGVYRVSWLSGRIPSLSGAPTVSNLISSGGLPCVASVLSYTSTSVDIDVRDFTGAPETDPFEFVLQVY